MLRIILKVAVWTTLLLIAVAAYAGNPYQKPRLPIQVTIAPVHQTITSSTIKPNDVVDIEVKGVSLLDVADMNLQVELLKGAELVSGDVSWKGSAAKGEQKALLISVRAPSSGIGRVRAILSVTAGYGRPMTVETQFLLGADNSSHQHKKPAPVNKKDSKGRDIQEFR